MNETSVTPYLKVRIVQAASESEAREQCQRVGDAWSHKMYHLRCVKVGVARMPRTFFERLFRKPHCWMVQCEFEELR